MIGHQIEIEVNGKKVITLADILPDNGPMKMLMVAKTPALVSVQAGHYFQGQQGKILWSQFRKYGLLSVPSGSYKDDHLLENGYGITDIVKVPRDFGSEPSKMEYKEGVDRIIETISCLKPHVVTFVYKGVLDNILKIKHERRNNAIYGFNSDLKEVFGCEVFALPLPGVGGVNGSYIEREMGSLKKKLNIDNR